jgi:hypothetical protein
MAAAMSIGEFTLEVAFRASSMVGVQFFADGFGHLNRICFSHTTKIGEVGIEASFGSFSPLPVTIDYANVVKGGRSIPALTSPPYSPFIRFDITRVDKALWKSFGPRPIIHPPELALSGGNNLGEC